ncbi:hypothetical protein OF83DRAFT_924450 [Amylostereum chailletii]|nr:hypothetical protein OF83DRAFT_924450 [Amylostereum chailletii]
MSLVTGADPSTANSPPSLRCSRHLHTSCQIGVEATETAPVCPHGGGGARGRVRNSFCKAVNCLDSRMAAVLGVNSPALACVDMFSGARCQASWTPTRLWVKMASHRPRTRVGDVCGYEETGV